MLRCRENDLAVILKGPYIGFFVTVRKFLGTITGVRPDGFPGVSHNAWEVECAAIPRHYESNQKVAVEDANLQPIRPAPSGVTTETKKEITA